MGIVNRVKSRAVMLRGKAKVLAGRVTGNSKLQAEGRADQATGRIRRLFARLQAVLAKVRAAVPRRS